MMRQLLFSRQKPAQLIGSSLGALLGIFFLLFTLQAYLDFNALLRDKSDLVHPEFLIINKRVSMLSSLGGPKTFSKEEKEALANLEGIVRVAPFRSNQFPAAGSTMPGMPGGGRGLAAELFFESVPDAMLDVDLEQFTWKQGDEILPILIPSDYLKLYNFGFAPSQGMPQVSPQTLSQVSFQLRFDSLGIPIYKQARIVAYTQRIPSILVPDDFLAYANQAYVRSEEIVHPSRLIIESKDPSNATLLHFLDEQGYESNEEQLKNARLSNALKMIGGLLGFVSLLILLLSFLGFFQYAELSLHRNSYEIRTLQDLGMPASQLFKKYFQALAILISSVTILALLLTWSLQSWLQKTASNYGLELNEGLHSAVLLAAMLIFVLFILVQAFGIRRGIRKLGPFVSSSNSQ